MDKKRRCHGRRGLKVRPLLFVFCPGGRGILREIGFRLMKRAEPIPGSIPTKVRNVS